MKTLTRLLAIAALAALVLAATQRTQISAARAELARLEASSAKASLEPASELAAAKDAATEIAQLRAANRDIYKLRGEISQAREKRRAFQRMEAENAQFQEKIANLKANPAAAQTPPPFGNKGQFTPEAAIETTFWSMYQGDIETLSRIMPMATAEFEGMPPAEKTNNVNMLRAMAAMIEKLEITGREAASPDEARLSVRLIPRAGTTALAGREQATFMLRRTNEFWQIVGER